LRVTTILQNKRKYDDDDEAAVRPHFSTHKNRTMQKMQIKTLTIS